MHSGRYQSAFQASLWEPFAYSLTLNKSSGLYSFDNTTEERERERVHYINYIVPSRDPGAILADHCLTWEERCER